MIGYKEAFSVDMYDRIDAILEKKHLSRRQLAAKAGINEATFSAAFRRRTKTMPYDRAAAIARVLGVPVTEFLSDEEFTLSCLSRTMDEPTANGQATVSVTVKGDTGASDSYSKNIPSCDANRIMELISLATDLDRTGQEKVLSYTQGLVDSRNFDGQNARPR